MDNAYITVQYSRSHKQLNSNNMHLSDIYNFVASGCDTFLWTDGISALVLFANSILQFHFVLHISFCFALHFCGNHLLGLMS